MFKFIAVSIAGGILFGILDGLINANPLAQKLYEIYRPLVKSPVNVQAGIVIDLAYGFLLAGIFLLLFKSLPGEAGIVKGFSYGILVWFFRIVMGAASQFVMYKVPATTLLYTLAAGLVEMVVLGILYGLTLEPA